MVSLHLATTLLYVKESKYAVTPQMDYTRKVLLVRQNASLLSSFSDFMGVERQATIVAKLLGSPGTEEWHSMSLLVCTRRGIDR